MDNSVVNNSIIKHGDCSVHKMPEGRQEVHEKYGLWICRYGRDGSSLPQKPPNEPRYFEFYCISHLIKGRGWYWVPRKPLEVFEEGKAVMVSPLFIHCVTADTTAIMLKTPYVSRASSPTVFSKPEY